jgi:hypothetical protein
MTVVVLMEPLLALHFQHTTDGSPPTRPRTNHHEKTAEESIYRSHRQKYTASAD